MPGWSKRTDKQLTDVLERTGTSMQTTHDAVDYGTAQKLRVSTFIRRVVQGAFVVGAALLAIACGAPSATIVPTAIPVPASTPAPGLADEAGPCAGTEPVATTPADPAQQSVFFSFRLEETSPYQNVRMRTIKNDGSFATVVLCAELRRSADRDWQAYSGQYELSLVGGSWNVSHDPLQSVTSGFLPVSAQATEQAVDTARAAAEQAAVDAKKTLHFSTVKNEQVSDSSFGLRYWNITFELQSADGQQHRVMFVPHVKGTLHQCAVTGLEGHEAQLELLGLVSNEPQEVIGPEPSQRTYAFQGQRETEDLFGHPQCTVLDDLRDLQVDIDQVDGVSATIMRRVEQRGFSAFATPGAVALTPAVAASAPGTNLSNPSAASGLSTSTTPSTTTDSAQRATGSAQSGAYADGVPLAVAGIIVAVLLGGGWFAARRLRDRSQRRRQPHAHHSTFAPGGDEPVVRTGTFPPSYRMATPLSRESSEAICQPFLITHSTWA
jgi:hypothetical protein